MEFTNPNVGLLVILAGILVVAILGTRYQIRWAREFQERLIAKHGSQWKDPLIRPLFMLLGVLVLAPGAAFGILILAPGTLPLKGTFIAIAADIIVALGVYIGLARRIA